MRVFISLSFLFILQIPACFLVACAPVFIEHHRRPATGTVKGYAVPTYPSLYDMCSRWRTSFTQEPDRRGLTLERATAAHRSKEQATKSLKKAAPRATTVLLVMSLQQEDKGLAMTSNSSLDSRTLSVYIYRTLKIVMTSFQCSVGRVVAVVGRIGSTDDDLIVTGLILSIMMQVMLVYWIWMDASGVCIWNPFYWIQAMTLICSFFASRSRMNWMAFSNTSQTLCKEDLCKGRKSGGISDDSHTSRLPRGKCQSKDAQTGIIGYYRYGHCGHVFTFRMKPSIFPMLPLLIDLGVTMCEVLFKYLPADADI